MEEEISVLESIFGESFVLLQRGGRPSFRVVLGLLADAELSCEITIVLPKKYPETTEPLHVVIKSGTLDDAQVAKLLAHVTDVVTAKCVHRTGYLFDTVIACKEELERLAGAAVPSSFEQMAQRQSLLAEAQLQERARALASSMQDEARHAAELRSRVDADRQRAGPQVGAPPLAALPPPTSSPPDRGALPGADETLASEDSALAARDGPLSPVDALSPSAAASRFRSDFKELGVLGKGGFGRVVKVLNLVDGMTYAVKLVTLSADEGENRKLIREVHTLSRLHHRHVVRYFQAWIEKGDDEDRSSGDAAEYADDTTSADASAAVVAAAPPCLPVTIDPPSRGAVPGALANPRLAMAVADTEADWIELETSHSVRLNSSGRRRSRIARAATLHVPNDGAVAIPPAQQAGGPDALDSASSSSSWSDDETSSDDSASTGCARSYGEVHADYFAGGLDIDALMQPALPRQVLRAETRAGKQAARGQHGTCAPDVSLESPAYVPRVLYIQVRDKVGAHSL